MPARFNTSVYFTPRNNFPPDLAMRNSRTDIANGVKKRRTNPQVFSAFLENTFPHHEYICIHHLGMIPFTFRDIIKGKGKILT